MLSLHNKPTLSLPVDLSLIPSKPRTIISQLLASDDFGKTTNYKHLHYSSSLSSACVVHAAKKDSQFEIDPDEAKAALQKLDQQLQTLSKKQVKPPKIKATDMKLTRGQTAVEMPEISQSFLAYTAAALLIFTIFYNVLFYAVIKPSIDGPDDVAEPTPASTLETQLPNAAVLQSLLSLPKDFIQPCSLSYL